MEFCVQLRYPAFQLFQFGFEAGCAQTFGDRIIKTVQLACGCIAFVLQAGAFDACFVSLGIRFLAEGLHELRHGIRLHQPITKQVQNCFFENVPAHRFVLIAGAKFARRRTGQVILANGTETASAMSAISQTGQEMDLAALLPELRGLDGLYARFGCDLSLPVFYRVPELIIHDAQVRDIGDDPFGGIVEPGHTASGLRVLEIAQPVPDQPPHIEFVVEQPGAPLAVAPNGRITPELPTRSGNVFGVQPLRNRLGRVPVCKFPKHPTNDLRFGLVDLALTRDRRAVRSHAAHDIVAVAVAATGQTGFDTAPKTTTRLGGEILQEQLVHGALEADMQFLDLAFRQRDDRHTGKGQPLVDRGNIGLIAAQAIQGFRENDVEAAGLRFAQE